MVIGIDAKWYYNGPVSGKVVLQNLFKYLVLSDNEHEWVIFLDRRFKGYPFMLEQSNVKLCYVWSDVNALSNIFILPFYASKYKVDILFFKFFVSPFFSCKKICFLYDNLFDDFPEFFSKSERAYFFFIKFFQRYADIIIVNTEYVKGRLIAHNYTKQPSKIQVISLGVDYIFKPKQLVNGQVLAAFKEKYKLPEKYILYVGRLNTRKNVETLINSIPYWTENRIPLIVIGNLDGVQTQFQSLLQNSEIKNRVFIFSSIKTEELIFFYASAYIFCFPSYAEGFGLPPLEAMASGIPVAISNTTCLPEVCGNAATYFEPSSPKDIASAINILLQDDILYSQKVRLGLDRANQFNWEKFAKELRELIHYYSEI